MSPSAPRQAEDVASFDTGELKEALGFGACSDNYSSDDERKSKKI